MTISCRAKVVKPRNLPRHLTKAATHQLHGPTLSPKMIFAWRVVQSPLLDDAGFPILKAPTRTPRGESIIASTNYRLLCALGLRSHAIFVRSGEKSLSGPAKNATGPSPAKAAHSRPGKDHHRGTG